MEAHGEDQIFSQKMDDIFRKFLIVGLILLIWPANVRADMTPMTGAAVAPNIAEITITNEGVGVTLEIYVGDLASFEDLLPNNWMPSGSAPRAPKSERLRWFSENGLSIRTGNGDVLPVSLQLIEPRYRVDRAPPSAGKIDPITGRMFPKPPEDNRVIYAELFYDFEGRKPARLEISPPLAGKNKNVLSIGFVLFDRDVPVTDFRYLSSTAKLTLDWADPWYSKFENPNLKRHHRNPVMTFIYAEPYEIRHEALMRVRDAATLTGVDLKGEFLSNQERDAIDAALPDLVNDRSPMTVDGATVTPDFERLSYLRVSPSGLVLLEDGEKVRSDAAIIGLIYSKPTGQFAKEATVEWTLFTEKIQEIPAQTIDAAGPFLGELTPDDPVLVWTNHFKKPPYPEIATIAVKGEPDQAWLLTVLAAAAVLFLLVFAVSWIAPHRVTHRWGAVAVLCAAISVVAIPSVRAVQERAALQIGKDQYTKLAENVLKNVYRAFDFKLEEQVYDRLSLTLTGEVLEQVFLEQRSALRVERAGGAQARVERLEITKTEKLPSEDSGTLRLFVEWGISGIVGHWGHNHRRSNDYAAELVVEPEDGAWKISKFDILVQERRP